MGIEGIHVFLPGGEDGALDKAGVLSIGSDVERAINMVDEAARVVVQLIGSDHEGGMTTCSEGGGGGGGVGSRRGVRDVDKRRRRGEWLPSFC